MIHFFVEQTQAPAFLSETTRGQSSSKQTRSSRDMAQPRFACTNQLKDLPVYFCRIRYGRPAVLVCFCFPKDRMDRCGSRLEETGSQGGFPHSLVRSTSTRLSLLCPARVAICRSLLSQPRRLAFFFLPSHSIGALRQLLCSYLVGDLTPLSKFCPKHSYPSFELDVDTHFVRPASLRSVIGP